MAFVSYAKIKSQYKGWIGECGLDVKSKGEPGLMGTADDEKNPIC